MIARFVGAMNHQTPCNKQRLSNQTVVVARLHRRMLHGLCKEGVLITAIMKVRFPRTRRQRKARWWHSKQRHSPRRRCHCLKSVPREADHKCRTYSHFSHCCKTRKSEVELQTKNRQFRSVGQKSQCELFTWNTVHLKTPTWKNCFRRISKNLISCLGVISLPCQYI